MSNWTQPLCQGCWQVKHGQRRPMRMKDADPEICCQCGRLTSAGIYVRIDPASVPYPSQEVAL